MVVSKPYPKVKEQELQTLCKNISKLTKQKDLIINIIKMKE